MEARKQTDIAPPTPEQLLKLLEIQLGQERGRRARKSRNRATFLVTGIFVILAAAAVAMIVAQQMLAELRERGALTPETSMAGEMR